MVVALVAVLIVTFIATYWARSLAYDKGRHVGGWMFATVMFPPVVLILWMLSPRTAPAA